MNKSIFIDIDNTICHTEGCDYEAAKPIQENIDRANQLYHDGNHITYWTARGAGSGLDHTRLTQEQLKRWGVCYHELSFDKPMYDVLIDDKAAWWEEIV
jgi:FMN phosphatase YigB (HAD superfamily)